MKSQVQSVITILQTEYDKYASGLMTEEAAKAGEAGRGFAVVAEEIEHINTQRELMTSNIDVLNQLATDNAASTEETSAMAMELDDAVRSSSTIVQEVLSRTNALVENANRFKL